MEAEAGTRVRSHLSFEHGATGAAVRASRIRPSVCSYGARFSRAREQPPRTGSRGAADGPSVRRPPRRQGAAARKNAAPCQRQHRWPLAAGEPSGPFRSSVTRSRRGGAIDRRRAPHPTHGSGTGGDGRRVACPLRTHMVVARLVLQSHWEVRLPALVLVQHAFPLLTAAAQGAKSSRLVWQSGKVAIVAAIVVMAKKVRAVRAVEARPM